MPKHDQEPQYHPINMLPTFTYMINGELEAAQEQLRNLDPVRDTPWVLDDFTVGRVIQVFTEQHDHLPHFDEQLKRWSITTITPEQRHEVERLQGQMVKLHEVVEAILKIADELKQGTIEKQLAKSDLEIGMEMLLKQWRMEK